MFKGTIIFLSPFILLALVSLSAFPSPTNPSTQPGNAITCAQLFQRIVFSEVLELTNEQRREIAARFLNRNTLTDQEWNSIERIRQVRLGQEPTVRQIHQRMTSLRQFFTSQEIRVILGMASTGQVPPSQPRQNVLITGGSSGIGSAMVEAFARQGYNVWFTYNRGEERAQQLISSLSQFNVRAFQLDQGNPQSIDALLTELPGSVHILINNAGLGTKTVETYAPTSQLQDQGLMVVNSLGPVWLTSKILPRMREQGFGTIIFISSVDGGITAFPGARYADGMSKAAMTHFARQLSIENADQPIDVYTVCPGATETPMFQASTLSRMTADQRRLFEQSLPRGRLIDPTEIADVALFLSSPVGRILRGQILDASMGLGSNPSAIRRGN